MVLFSILFTIISYLKSSIKLSIFGESAILEIILIFFLIIALVYIHLTFKHDITEVSVAAAAEQLEEYEESEKEEDIVLPEAFRKEYNFLRENAKSLTTLFENYIQRRVSHDTLLRQFQASQEDTFLQMRSRVRSDLDISRDVLNTMVQNDTPKINLCLENDESEITENAFEDLQISGSGDMQVKNKDSTCPVVF